MIRIYSGYSECGGSCLAFINLTNALNQAGYDTTFYGTNSFPLNRCKYVQLKTKLIEHNPEDSLIIHYITNPFNNKPNVKKLIYSSHEQEVYPIKGINYKIFDKIHYVSDHQRQFHNVNHPYFILPNVLDSLVPNPKPNKKVAGIIGSIDRNKQTHISIERAIQDGFEDIWIFGNIHDPIYYEQKVDSLIDGKRVKMLGYMENKQKMYDMITHMYISSLRECLPYTIGECMKTNTIVCGIEGKNYLDCKFMDTEEIVKKWVEELGIEKKNEEKIVVNEKPKISAYFVCFNEAHIIPHLLRYYSTFCDKITIVDNFSNDGTEEIVKKFKNTEIEKFDTDGKFRDDIHARIKNNIWKKDVGKFDYIIVADADEFIVHSDFIKFLEDKRKEGYTIFRPYGFHMIADLDLDLKEDDNIFEKVNMGLRITSMDKFSMFDCNKIKEINLSVGAHSCNPIGDIKLYYKDDLKLKHFKFLGMKNHLEGCRAIKARFSEFNRRNNLATYYLETDSYHERDYMNFYNQRTLV